MGTTYNVFLSPKFTRKIHFSGILWLKGSNDHLGWPRKEKIEQLIWIYICNYSNCQLIFSNVFEPFCWAAFLSNCEWRPCSLYQRLIFISKLTQVNLQNYRWLVVTLFDILILLQLRTWERFLSSYRTPHCNWKWFFSSVAPNSLSFCFCLSLSNLMNYKSAAFRSLTILNLATFLSTPDYRVRVSSYFKFFSLPNYQSSSSNMTIRNSAGK